MSVVALNVNFEDVWCKSCGQPTFVAVGMMNAHRDKGRDVFCSACGRRYGRSEPVPTNVIDEQREQLERGCEAMEKLERKNAGLRGTVTRLQRQLAEARGKAGR